MRKGIISNLKRLFAIVATICMIFSVSPINSFAAETTTPVDPIDIDESSGDVMKSGMKSIVNSATISLTLSSGHWGVDFAAGVHGNPGADYYVELYGPNNIYASSFVTGGSSKLTLLTSVIYAPAGTYKFVFSRVSGAQESASAIAEIVD